MPRHRNRQHATHLLTAEREQQVGEDDYESPIYENVEVLADEPVRYDSGGTTYLRDGGERVERTPMATGHGGLADELREGDTVALEPLDPDAVGLSDLEIRGIAAEYGRRARRGSTTLELEQH